MWCVKSVIWHVSYSLWVGPLFNINLRNLTREIRTGRAFPEALSGVLDRSSEFTCGKSSEGEPKPPTEH